MIHTVVQCVLFFLTIYCYRAWLNRRKWQLLRRLPGPANLPFIGAMYLIPGTDTTQYLSTLIELTANYGSPLCVWLGPLPVVIVSTADHARSVLTSPATMEKASFYRFTPLRGIFSLPVNQWRPHRKVIQPTFKLSILQSFIPLFEQKANIMVQNLSEKADQCHTFDIYRFTARCTLDMIFATTLGTNMHIQETPTCSYLEVLEELFEIVTVRAVNIFLHPEWLYQFTSVYRKEARALKEFCHPSKHILSQQKHDHTTPSNSLIDQLQNAMACDGTTADIERELNTIIFAGNETSAMTVANTILLIAMHPPVQHKLMDEIRTHFGHDVSNIHYETLNKLTYMEMVLKESLRMLPVAAVIGRKTTADIDLGDYRLPAGVDILIDIFDMHRNPTYWGPDADRFRPERFETISYDRFSFLPFSAGPRNCVGLRYAWISMKIMLLKVLARYSLETDLKLADLGMKMALTMKIVNGHMVRLKSRQ
ncbi:cytochrome P450 4V2-like [Anopheles ziemanni]|uniref:cytochrome P450 4V2-like n=1 Tax=Anopheles coustani TaxID=139045 RepID=UPI00265A1C09|nr:cytochrome P450 4V2-like [Anopheles coustani]XP_058170934.1 cytochrome P450 4V2-like [Anopheles ziemanni]